jgi:hypothetical protein
LKAPQPVNFLIGGVGLVALGTMLGGRTLADGFEFLFGIDKSFIDHGDAGLSKLELWNMHNGVWCGVMILMGIAAFCFGFRGVRRSRKASK